MAQQTLYFCDGCGDETPGDMPIEGIDYDGKAYRIFLDVNAQEPADLCFACYADILETAAQKAKAKIPTQPSADAEARQALKEESK